MRKYPRIDRPPADGRIVRAAAPPGREQAALRFDDARLATVLAADTPLLLLHAGAIHLEGPAWQETERRLVLSDVPNRRLLAWHGDGRVEVLLEGAWFVNGNAVSADGAIWHCEHGRRCVSRSDPATQDAPGPVATHYRGRRLNSPNDVAVAPDGALWFTDPIFGLVMPSQGALAEPELDHRSVYRIDPVTGEPERMADLDQPNGLAFAPDGRTLYVSDSSQALGEAPGHVSGREHAVYAFDVGADGALSNRRRLMATDRGCPDGLAVDRRGWLWIGAADGVHVRSPGGDSLGFVPLPSVVTNLCFGGGDGRRLFVTASDRLYALDLIG